MLRGQPREGSLAARLEAFYAPQAAHYDHFRERLLHGRQTLIDALGIAPGMHVLELGAGTGRNVDFYADVAPSLASLTLVDLCPSLLAHARHRVVNWPHAKLVEADATRFRATRPFDRIYCSYALSMMPEWSYVLDNACAQLAPGGLIGVVDFHVSGARRLPGRVHHGLATRLFWPWWFAHDGVTVSPAVLESLLARCEAVHLFECRGALPYLPGVSVPYFVFVGHPR